MCWDWDDSWGLCCRVKKAAAQSDLCYWCSCIFVWFSSTGVNQLWAICLNHCLWPERFYRMAKGSMRYRCYTEWIGLKDSLSETRHVGVYMCILVLRVRWLQSFCKKKITESAIKIGHRRWLSFWMQKLSFEPGLFWMVCLIWDFGGYLDGQWARRESWLVTGAFQYPNNHPFIHLLLI
jgi:hypothetical protein